jgi:hypothetical protein
VRVTRRMVDEDCWVSPSACARQPQAMPMINYYSPRKIMSGRKTIKWVATPAQENGVAKFLGLKLNLMGKRLTIY